MSHSGPPSIHSAAAAYDDDDDDDTALDRYPAGDKSLISFDERQDRRLAETAATRYTQMEDFQLLIINNELIITFFWY